MKKISIVTSCINEEENILQFYKTLYEMLKNYATKYFFEIVIVDDCSQDSTQEILRKIAHDDRRVKLVFNSRTFGELKSSYYAICQATGDAVIYFPIDFQINVEKISDFIDAWESGCEIVCARKISKKTFSFINLVRKIYYLAMYTFKDEGTAPIMGYKGYGLYTRKVINKIKEINDPYPYLKGAILDLGYTTKILDYEATESNEDDDNLGFISMWNNGMLGLTKSTKTPVHIITIIGFFGAIISLLLIFLSLICYIGYINFVIPKKMLSLYFLMFVQIFSLGLIGEYVISLCRFAENKPIVIEKERINF